MAGAGRERLLRAERVTFSAYIQPAAEKGGPGICGLTRPLKVAALQKARTRPAAGVRPEPPTVMKPRALDFHCRHALTTLLASAPSVSRALDTRTADALLKQGRFDQNLGAQVPLDAVFRDESGQPTALRGVLGPRPAILVLGYHECPDALLAGAGRTGGVDERPATDLRRRLRPDRREHQPHGHPGAGRAAETHVFQAVRPPRRGRGLAFLTSPDPATIRRLADAVGFHGTPTTPSAKQFAHPSGLVILTPDGKVARYFFGVNFDPGDLQTALVAAGQRKVGSRIQELLLTCFHYNPITGKYGALIINAVRVGGVLTLLAMAGGLVYLVRRSRL